MRMILILLVAYTSIVSAQIHRNEVDPVGKQIVSRSNGNFLILHCEYRDIDKKCLKSQLLESIGLEYFDIIHKKTIDHKKLQDRRSQYLRELKYYSKTHINFVYQYDEDEVSPFVITRIALHLGHYPGVALAIPFYIIIDLVKLPWDLALQSVIQVKILVNIKRNSKAYSSLLGQRDKNIKMNKKNYNKFKKDFISI